jgi:hypothetical protein
LERQHKKAAEKDGSSAEVCVAAVEIDRVLFCSRIVIVVIICYLVHVESKTIFSIAFQVVAQRVAAVLARISSSSDSCAAVANADLAIEGETCYNPRAHSHITPSKL